MGYVYDSRTGQLCCDVCGNHGGVRRVRCKYGYCQSTAMCAKDRSDKATRASQEAYCDAYCKAASEAFKAREAKKAALLDAGEYVRTAAVAKGKAVEVTFRNAAGDAKVYRMDRDTYGAFDLSAVTTVADYERHGEVIAA